MSAFVLDLLIRSTLVLAVCAVAWALSRRRGAALRHGILLAGLLSLLLLPILLLYLPEWRLAVLPQAPTGSGKVQRAPAGSRREPVRKPLARPAAPASERVSELRAEPRAPASPVRHSGDPLAGAAVWVYLAGCAGGLLHLFTQLARLRRFSRQCVRTQNAALLRELEAAAALLGVRRLPELRLSAESPMTWGWRRPVVALPSDAPEWPAERLRGVLLHELSHVRRADWMWGLVARGVCSLYWFHPLVWWLSARLTEESEAACDDRVLAAGMPAPAYAQSLLEVIQTMSDRKQPLLTGVGMARGRRFEGRVRAILDGNRKRGSVTTGVLGALAVVSAAILLPSAGVRLAPRPAAAQEAPLTTHPAPVKRIQPALAPQAPRSVSPAIPKPEKHPAAAPVIAAAPAVSEDEVRVRTRPDSEMESERAVERELRLRAAELERRLGSLQERRARARTEAPELLIQRLEQRLAELEEQLLLQQAKRLTERHVDVQREEELRELVQKRLEQEKKRRVQDEERFRAQEMALRKQAEELRARAEAGRKRSEAEHVRILEKQARELERSVRERVRGDVRALAEGMRRDTGVQAERIRSEALKTALEALRQERSALEERIRELERRLRAAE